MNSKEIDALKRAVSPSNKWGGNPENNRFDIGWNHCIDHLSQRGLLAPQVEEIAGLEEALIDHHCASDAILGKNIDILAEAATKYLAMMKVNNE